jgi:hypothetical protein
VSTLPRARRIAGSFGTKRGKVGDLTPICVVKLVMALSDDVQDKLGKRVDDCYWRRLLQERLARRTTAVDVGALAQIEASHRFIGSPVDNLLGDGAYAPITGGSVLDSVSVGRQESLESYASTISSMSNLNLAPGDHSNKNNGSFDVNDKAITVLNNPSVCDSVSEMLANASTCEGGSSVDLAVSQAIEGFLAMPMDDMDEFGNTVNRCDDMGDSLPAQPSVVEVKASAATAIQRLARGADARSLADKRYQNVSIRQ